MLFRSLLLLAAAAFPVATLQAALVAWYKFDEPSGLSVLDSSGRGHHLQFDGSGHSRTLKTGAPFTGSGQSLSFNGSGTALAVDSSAATFQTQTIAGLRARSGNKATIAFWANPTAETGTSSPFSISRLDEGVPQRLLQAHVLLTDGKTYFDADNDGDPLTPYARLSAATTSPPNTWVHWAFVFDNSAGAGAMKIYRDGTLLASGASSVAGNLPWPLIDSFELGGLTGGTNWSGALDDFALWDKALTAGQIATVKNSGVNAFFRPNLETLTANPGNVTSGAPVILNWTLAEGPFTSVVLTPGNVNLTANTINRFGSFTVNPTATTTYTLTATGPGGSSARSVLVGVGLPESDFRLNEIMADNDGPLYDDDGDASDWIEIHNPNSFSKSLAGWKLSLGTSTWTFPAVNLPAQGYLTLFASGEDRSLPSRPLHTSFKLPREGSTLLLLRPDASLSASLTYPGQTPSFSYGATAANPATYSHMSPTPSAANGAVGTPGPLIADISTGLLDTLGKVRQPRRPGVASGTKVADSKAQFSTTQGTNGWTYGWTTQNTTNYGGTFTQFTTGEVFSGAWRRVASGAPYTSLAAEHSHPNGSGSTGGLQTTVRRWTSTFAGTAVLDGFVHHIANAGGGTRWQLYKNGTALLDGDTATGGNQPVTVRTTLRSFTLQTTLAVGDRLDLVCDAGSDGLEASDSSRCLLRVYQPLAANPALHDTALPVTATILPTVAPVQTANLIYRMDFGSETTLAMTSLGGSLYSASIPLGNLRGGQLLRWRVTATDTSARVSKLPAYLDPLDSPEYEGTVALDPVLAANSKLPAFHIFSPNPLNLTTATGARSSLFYDGVLYDNIQIDAHALPGSSSTYAKKSMDIDFNKGKRFKYYPGGPGHTDVNLITNWRDRSKLRNPLAYGIYGLSAGATMPGLPVRVSTNGAFYGILDLIGEGNEGVLEEAGLDPNGALYKVQNRLNDVSFASAASVEKKTRKGEGVEDLEALITGVNLANGTPRNIFISDNVDLPASVNFIAATTAATSTDWGHKNYMMYRDSDGTGMWRPIPWDRDLSFGHVWNAAETYFDDDLISYTTNKAAVYNSVNGVPDNNNFFRTFWDDAAIRGMCQRRIRTLLDQFWATTAVPTLEERMDAYLELVDPAGVAESDADLDDLYWGHWNQHFSTYPYRSAANEIARLKTQFIPNQRTIFFTNSDTFNGGPFPGSQPAVPAGLSFGSFAQNPAVTDQEFVEIVNSSSVYVDLSGWSLAGGITHTFPAGAVISPAGNSRFNGRLYVSRSPFGWKTRTTSPKPGEGKLVVFGYKGQLSSRGDTVQLLNPAGTVVATLTVPPAPSALQNFLRITEINYNPANATPAEAAALPGVATQDFEFVELTNTGTASLDVSGCHFDEGITFTLPASTSLPAGASLVIAKRPEAFTLRYGSVPNLFGGYVDNLSNSGERITLREPNGETILSFLYSDLRFKPALGSDPTDGQGRTLVAGNSLAAYTEWDNPDFWRISASANGTPGTSPAGTAAFAWNYETWRKSWFDATERLNESLSGPAVAGSDGVSQTLRYALGLPRAGLDRAKLPAAQLVVVGPDRFLALTHRRLKSQVDLTYTVETTTDFVIWTPAATLVGSPTDNDDGTETVTVRSATPATDSTTRQHIRLRVQLSP